VQFQELLFEVALSKRAKAHEVGVVDSQKIEICRCYFTHVLLRAFSPGSRIVPAFGIARYGCLPPVAHQSGFLYCHATQKNCCGAKQYSKSDIIFRIRATGRLPPHGAEIEEN
jgi:hypothetical protein